MTQLLKSCFRVEPFEAIGIDLERNNSKSYDPYTTGDLIEGLVWIQTDLRLRPEDVKISFCGESQVKSEGIFLPISTYRKKRFLQLQQLIDEACLSPTKSLKSRFSYRIPFTFVVPDQLPVQTCRHIRDDWEKSSGHLLLPPTLEWSSNSRRNHDSSDDFCGSNMSITYSLQATVSNGEQLEARGPWNYAFKSIQLVPSYNKEFKMGVSPTAELMPTRSSRLIKAVHGQSAKGMLFAGAWNPGPVQLPLFCNEKSGLSTPVTEIDLDFQPSQHGPPPSLRHISKKLIVHTVAHSMPFRPTPTGPACRSRAQIITRTVSLGNMDLSSVKFVPLEVEHHLAGAEKGNSLANLPSQGCTVSDIPSQRRIYTTSIKVPIILPENKALVPSFESCLISRSYEIDIQIYYGSGWKGLGTSSLSFRLPLQIVS